MMFLWKKMIAFLWRSPRALWILTSKWVCTWKVLSQNLVQVCQFPSRGQTTQQPGLRRRNVFVFLFQNSKPFKTWYFTRQQQLLCGFLAVFSSRFVFLTKVSPLGMIGGVPVGMQMPGQENRNQSVYQAFLNVKKREKGLACDNGV